jgi:hypothetical protein
MKQGAVVELDYRHGARRSCETAVGPMESPHFSKLADSVIRQDLKYCLVTDTKTFRSISFSRLADGQARSDTSGRC